MSKETALPRIGRILAAVADPSASRQPAVERAVQLALALGARLVLFHAAFESALSGRPFFDSRRLARSRGFFVADRMQLLELRAKKLRARGLTVDVRVVWEAPVHEAVIRAAIRDKADLIVVGRHERRGDRAPQFRLTEWDLMRLCPRPLLITRGAPAPRASGAVLSALDPTHAYDKPASLDASIAAHAAAIASALQVEHHAVHCVPRGAYELGSEAAQRRRIDRRMHAKLLDLMERHGADGTAVHVVHGEASDCLPRFASKLPAQMIAIGVISRRWLKRFVIGDTAETLISAAPCDLLLIKPDDFELRLGRIRKEPVELPKESARR